MPTARRRAAKETWTCEERTTNLVLQTYLLITLFEVTNKPPTIRVTEPSKGHELKKLEPSLRAEAISSDVHP